jgi:hypothetical protein
MCDHTRCVRGPHYLISNHHLPVDSYRFRMPLPTTNLEEHKEWDKTMHLLRLVANVNHDNDKLGVTQLVQDIPALTDAVAALLVQRHEIVAVAIKSPTQVAGVVSEDTVSVSIVLYDETNIPLD